MTAPAVTLRPFWEEEGRRIAPEMAEIAAVVVVGADPIAAALVARGIAAAASETRQVVLGDLVGDLAPIYEIAGGEDAAGLTDCFREGLPLNEVARRAPGSESLFVLPAGTPPVAVAEMLAHERWARLVAGFAQAKALLVLVAPLHAPELGALVAATSGVVAVGTPRDALKRFPVIATVDAPPPAKRTRRPPAARRNAVGFAVVLLLGAALAGWYVRRDASRPRSTPDVTGPVVITPAVVPPPPAIAVADTVQFTDPVNPSDTSLLAPFALELMAANTLTGANSFLAARAGAFNHSAVTVSPVAVGGGSSLWYKVIVGAWRERAGADSVLVDMRTRDAPGRVVRVPYAFLLAERVEALQREQVVRSWRQRGISAYALLQSDGGVSVFTGAFETPTQAAPLAAVLRAAGVTPVLAIRTGRML